MLAYVHKNDDGSLSALQMQMARICKEMPEFMSWLRESEEDTTALCVVNDGVEHERSVGELRSLRDILKCLRNPSDIE